MVENGEDLSIQSSSLKKLSIKKYIGRKYYIETLKQNFPAIQHAGNVTLSDWRVKVLGAMEKKDLLSPMANVKFLKLNAFLMEYAEIAGLLKIFPKLEMLVLDEDEYHSRYAQESLKFEKNLPESFLLQLKIVEVIWSRWWSPNGIPIFPFVQFVLKYASKLEKMVIRAKDAPETFYLSSEKLL